MFECWIKYCEIDQKLDLGVCILKVWSCQHILKWVYHRNIIGIYIIDKLCLIENININNYAGRALNGGYLISSNEIFLEMFVYVIV